MHFLLVLFESIVEMNQSEGLRMIEDQIPAFAFIGLSDGTVLSPHFSYSYFTNIVTVKYIVLMLKPNYT